MTMRHRAIIFAWLTGRPNCWEVVRNDTTKRQSTTTFFGNALRGIVCDTNWYEGNVGLLGLPNRPPRFIGPAPALYGFDENIDDYCATEMRKVLCSAHARRRGASGTEMLMCATS